MTTALSGIAGQDEARRIRQCEATRRWRVRNPAIPAPKRPACPDCSRNLSPEQWAYLAGIFDGEGSVLLASANNKDGRLRTYNLVVTVVCGTHLVAIEAIKEIIGHHGMVAAHGRKLEPINGKGSRRQAWRLRISAGHAAWFLKGVRPYLLMKTAQADLGISHQENKPGRGAKCDDARAAREHASKLEMTLLNQRGVPCAQL